MPSSEKVGSTKKAPTLLEFGYIFIHTNIVLGIQPTKIIMVLINIFLGSHSGTAKIWLGSLFLKVAHQLTTGLFTSPSKVRSQVLLVSNKEMNKMSSGQVYSRKSKWRQGETGSKSELGPAKQKKQDERTPWKTGWALMRRGHYRKFSGCSSFVLSKSWGNTWELLRTGPQ